MEEKLSQLFDYQRFQQHPKLADMLQAAESCYASALSDDELAMVSAAGSSDATQSAQKEEKPGMICIILPPVREEE